MTPAPKGFERRGGFSLVELAFVLAIIGVLGMSLLKVAAGLKSLPAAVNLTGAANGSANTLDQAEAALNGYILAHGRLPCPDSTAANIGIEVCSGSVSVGWLPARTLGLSLTERVRYGVYRAASASAAHDMDLAALPDRYRPLLPATLDAVEPVNLNGLDFCAGLRNLAGSAGAAVLTAGSQRIPIAYGLAVAGAGDADNVAVGGKKSLFDGLNGADGRFELAGTAHTAVYDDDTRTVGGAELFSRLGCASRLAAANAAARAAYAAYDLDLFTAAYVSFRNFQVTARQSDVKMAEVGRDLSIANLANGFGASASAIALLAETEGATTVAVISASAALLGAIPGVALAAINVNTKNDDLATARKQQTAAANFKSITGVDLIAAASLIVALDGKGLLP